MSPAADDPINNRYELIETLGQGGMGVVYSAFDRLNCQTIALKRLLTPVDKLQFSANSSSGNQKGADGNNRLLALAVEFRTLASLRHPNIISVLDYGFDTSGQPFFTMELLHRAQPITQAAKNQPLETQVRYLNELLLALAYLHRRGVIHHDLKPDNVLVTTNGQVKVLDFGLAAGAAIQSVTDFTEKLGGTLAYMAPELFSDSEATVQSDLYAVGMIAYEIFLGKLPFTMKRTALLFSDIMNKRPDTSALPPALASVLNRLLMKVPEVRPKTAERVIHDLCTATQQPLPTENQMIRESFLQASKFVGREREMTMLKAALDQLISQSANQQGSGAASQPEGTADLQPAALFYLLGGESGVGKSRLVDELRIRALVKGITVLRGQGVTGNGLPFQLWREPARRLILSTPMNDLEAGILKAVVPDISTVLGREVADAPELTGSAWQQRIVFTLIELFKRQNTPVLLILEDLQWAVESLAVLRHMLTLREQLPHLWVIGTYRDDERPDLHAKLPGIQIISLKPLNTDAIIDLSAAMLGEAGMQPQVIDFLQHETEGNAFFMVETVRALAEEAGRLADIGEMMLTDRGFTDGVPQIVRRRIKSLPESLRNWLKMVAVAGRQLDMPLVDYLAAQSGSMSNVQARHDRVIQSANAAVLEIVDGVWRFRHDKIREMLLAELADEECRLLNRQVAEAIETLYPNDASYNEVLLDHWHQAGDLDKELHYLNLVSEHLIEIDGGYDRANTLLKRALERLADDDVRRVSIWKWQVRSIRLQGDYYKVPPLAYNALVLARKLDDQYSVAFILNDLGALYLDLGHYAHAIQHFQESLTIFQAIGNNGGIAAVLHALGRTLFYLGDDREAHAYFQECLTIFQVMGDHAGIGRSFNGLGDVAQRQGDFALAREYYHQSLTHAQEVGHQYGIARSLANLGTVARRQADYEQARDYFRRSLVISQAVGDQRGIANGLNGLGFVHLMMQDHASQATLFKALSIANLHAQPIVLETMVGFAWLYLQRGKPTRAGELAGMIQHDPKYNSDVQERLNELLPLLRDVLSLEALNEAMERGKAFIPYTVERVVRAELG